MHRALVLSNWFQLSADRTVEQRACRLMVIRRMFTKRAWIVNTASTTQKNFQLWYQHAAHVYDCVQLCTTVYNTCTTVYNCVQLCTTVYNCVQLCTTVYNTCTTVYKRVQLCTTRVQHVYNCATAFFSRSIKIYSKSWHAVPVGNLSAESESHAPLPV